jgi:hypothetical protein
MTVRIRKVKQIVHADSYDNDELPGSKSPENFE